MANHTGKVVWFNNAKGFGFLNPPSGPDVFCHFSAVISDGYKTLREGDLVEFDIIQGEKGLQADKVRRLETATGRPVINPKEAGPQMRTPV